MKYTKKQLQEIVDADGELIGTDDVPQTGSNLESQANNTTDYNSKIGHQPYRYDMLGRFGFTLLPFFEGVEEEGNDPLVAEIAEYLYDHYLSMMKHYYKNPKALQQDYRKKSKLDFETDESNAHDIQMAKDILDIIKPHFEGAMKELDESLKEGLNENAFVEGKMLDKKDAKGVVEKDDDKEVTSKHIEKIAGLINKKLDKQDVNKLINLLENE
jgi:hypothetical protein